MTARPAPRARGPLLLVDYSSLLYRAYFSVPERVAMNGVHGFLSMLARLVVDRRPHALAVAVDEDWRPAFRVEALPMYKLHRVAEAAEGGEGAEEDPIVAQEAVGRELLAALGIAVVGAAGYEAEDVIATLAARSRRAVEIVSGDRDLFALVRDPRVRVLYPVVGVSTLREVDEAEIQRQYGIPGRAYGDYALLRGDPSDGLPGVPGIGAKTAARLISEHGSLAGVLRARTLTPPIARRLAAAETYLERAAAVVPPVATVPVGRPSMALPMAAARPRRLARLLDTHRLGGPVGRLCAALGWEAEGTHKQPK